MRLLKAIIPCCCLILAACAANKGVSNSDDYVQVDNPYYTMAPDAPEKVWVPRSSVEGLPRAGELVKKGAEQLVSKSSSQEEQRGAASQQPAAGLKQPQKNVTVASVAQPAAGKVQPVEAPAPPLKNRIALVESGQNGLARPLSDSLQAAGAGAIFDPEQAAFLAQFSTISDQKGKEAFAKRLQQEYGANVAVMVAAPKGVAPGNALTAEVYDAMGGSLLRSFDAVIPLYNEKDQAARSAAVASALATLTPKIKEVVVLLPWYGRIMAVEGSRAYIAAGKEAGLRLGQAVTVYRAGKNIEGVGFAPGEKIGTIVIGGFVGPNGSFAAIKGAEGIQANDLVSAE